MNIIRMEIKRRIKTMLIWACATALIMIMFMYFFPTFKDSGMQELLDSKLGAFPPELLKAMNLSMVDFSDIVQYFAYCFQYILMAGCIYAALLGAGAIVTEESEGTISFLYSKPVTRSKIISAKLISIFIIFFVYLIITAVTSVITCLILKPEDVQTVQMVTDLKKMMLAGFVTELVYMSIGFLISILLKSAKQATPISLGIFFITYFVGIAGKLSEKASYLIDFSPFCYFEPAAVIEKGYQIKTLYVFLSVSLIVIPVLLSYVLYNKKDLNG